MNRLVSVMVAAAVVGCTVVGGCETGRPARGPSASAEGPFAPASMRIFPLTHMDVSAAGEPVIVLHIELLDRWGDSTKGVGLLTVQLVPGTGGADPATAARTWDIDLADPEFNASVYDRATRTYRLQLGQVPAGLAGEGSSGFRLRALYALRGASAGTAPLRHEYVMDR